MWIQSLPLISPLWNVENTWIKYQDNIRILTHLTDLWKWLNELTHVSCLYQFLTHFKQDMLLFCCVSLHFLFSLPVSSAGRTASGCWHNKIRSSLWNFLKELKSLKMQRRGIIFITWLRSGLLREWTVLVWRDTRGLWILGSPIPLSQWDNLSIHSNH